MADETLASTPARRTEDEWPDRAADLLESTVTTVRTKAVDPLYKVAQLVVFGLILAAAGIGVMVLLIIGLIRLINVYLPVHPHARSVWITYAGLGAIFALGGAFFMRKRR